MLFEVTNCSSAHLLSSFSILTLVRTCNQQELPLQMAKYQETKYKHYKWPRISKCHQSEAVVHYKHKNFSIWHRKSLKKHSNNTDLISWLDFLGMLHSVIQHSKKRRKKPQNNPLFISRQHSEFCSLEKGNTGISKSVSSRHIPPLQRQQ